MNISSRSKFILEALLRFPEGLTREEISQMLVNAGDKFIDRRRLHKYIKAFREQQGLDIVTEHHGGTVYRYRLKDQKNLPVGFTAQMVANFLEFDFMQTFKDLGPRIQPVTIPRGTEFLRSIGDAMRLNHLLRVTYQKFSDIEPYDCILAPHVLKAFEGRWYLFAVKWWKLNDVKQLPLGYKGIGLQTFALDRMKNITVTNRRFKLLDGFDAETLFKPYFGVCCPADASPKKIVVHASEKDAHYIRTLPIHESQREVEHNVFELTLVPETDFDIYMRRYPDTTWEIIDK